jgi:predicted dithiol-disulfide oxidoreductase (DUF899 family)
MSFGPRRGHISRARQPELCPEEVEVSLPEVVSREHWVLARKELLAREKELTRQRDALNADRRRLPMVEIDEPYVFKGPDGTATLLDLFDGRRQLIVQHFMFGPDWEAGCPSCSSSVDEISQGLIDHLHTRDTSFALIARAPLVKVEAYRALRGWTLPFYSSFGSTFNYDFNVSLDESVAPIEYNYRTKGELEAAGLDWVATTDEMPGMSCFVRDGDRMFHTYSTFARGAEALGGSYYWLDLTTLGRQEEWEEPKGRSANARPASPDFSN